MSTRQHDGLSSVPWSVEEEEAWIRMQDEQYEQEQAETEALAETVAESPPPQTPTPPPKPSEVNAGREQRPQVDVLPGGLQGGLDCSPPSRRKTKQAPHDSAEQQLPDEDLLSIVETVAIDWQRPLPPVCPTGFKELDEALGGGLRAGSTAVLAGPTGRGKTGLALQQARHIAKTRDVLYLSSELSRRQVEARIIAQTMQMPWSQVYELGPSETQRLVEASRRASGERLFLLEVRKSLEIKPLVERFRSKRGAPPVVFLDYLQHAARRIGSEDARFAVSKLSQELTDVAREFETIVYVISSVSRAVATADTSLKTAADFTTTGKESGDIEFDTGAMLYLETNPTELDGGFYDAPLHLAKSRFSAGNKTIGLRFHGPTGIFHVNRESGLHPDLLACYQALKKHGPMSASDLAKTMELRKQEVIDRTNILMQKGYIQRNGAGSTTTLDIVDRFQT